MVFPHQFRAIRLHLEFPNLQNAELWARHTLVGCPILLRLSALEMLGEDTDVMNPQERSRATKVEARPTQVPASRNFSLPPP
jgi:hypothetical protein